MADLCLLWSGVLINNQTGCPREKIGDDFDNGGTDLVTVAQMVLPNPDFVERIRTRAPFNPADRNTLYGGGAEEGYTDHPTLVASNPA